MLESSPRMFVRRSLHLCVALLLATGFALGQNQPSPTNDPQDPNGFFASVIKSCRLGQDTLDLYRRAAVNPEIVSSDEWKDLDGRLHGADQGCPCPFTDARVHLERLRKMQLARSNPRARAQIVRDVMQFEPHKSIGDPGSLQALEYVMQKEREHIREAINAVEKCSQSCTENIQILCQSGYGTTVYAQQVCYRSQPYDVSTNGQKRPPLKGGVSQQGEPSDGGNSSYAPYPPYPPKPPPNPTPSPKRQKTIKGGVNTNNPRNTNTVKDGTSSSKTKPIPARVTDNQNPNATGPCREGSIRVALPGGGFDTVFVRILESHKDGDLVEGSIVEHGSSRSYYDYVGGYVERFPATKQNYFVIKDLWHRGQQTHVKSNNLRVTLGSVKPC